MEYLVKTRSRKELIRLVEIAQQRGYESALREICGIDGVTTLEAEWKAWLESAASQEAEPRLTTSAGFPPGNYGTLARPSFPGRMSRLLP